jgi:hypothetical protein
MISEAEMKLKVGEVDGNSGLLVAKDYPNYTIEIGGSSIAMGEVPVAEVIRFNEDYVALHRGDLMKDPQISPRIDPAWDLKQILRKNIVNAFISMRGARFKSQRGYEGMNTTGNGLTMSLLTANMFGLFTGTHQKYTWAYTTTTLTAFPFVSTYEASTDPLTVEKYASMALFALFQPPGNDGFTSMYRIEKNGKKIPCAQPDWDASPIYELPAVICVGGDQLYMSALPVAATNTVDYTKPWGVAFFPADRIRDIAKFGYSPIQSDSWA